MPDFKIWLLNFEISNIYLSVLSVGFIFLAYISEAATGYAVNSNVHQTDTCLIAVVGLLKGKMPFLSPNKQ